MAGEYKQHYTQFQRDPGQFWLEQSKRIPTTGQSGIRKTPVPNATIAKILIPAVARCTADVPSI